MATESVTKQPAGIVCEAKAECADAGECYITRGWRERGNALGMSTANCMASADRALHGLMSIVETLVEDERRKSCADVTGEAYAGLAPIDVEQFGIAAVELGNYAITMLEQVREHRDGAGAGA